MPLPKVNIPEYITKLPSTGETVKYRPYLVKEQKIFLIAQNTGKQENIINAVKNILKECVQCETKVQDMALFDIEFLFLNVRARSDGEEINLTVICPDDKKTEVDVTINIDDISVTFPEEHTNIVNLDNGMKFVMRYPNIDSVLKLDTKGDIETPENTFKMTEFCLKEVYYEDEVYNFQDFSKKERTEFLEQLTAKDYNKILKFFTTMPSMSHEFEVLNPVTKVKNKITLSGINDFL